MLIGIYRNEFIQELTKEEQQSEDVFCMYDLIDVLQYMKKHPIKSFVYIGSQQDRIYDEINNIRVLKIFIKDWYYDKKYKLKDYLKLKRHIRLAKRFVKQLPDFNVLLLLRPDNWSPRVDIKLRRRKDIDLKRYEKQVDIIDNFEDKYGWEISVSEYEKYLNQQSTSDDIKKDKELQQSFYTYINYLNKSDDEDSKILFSQILDTVPDIEIKDEIY